MKYLQTIQFAAKYSLGILSKEHYPDFALSMLEEGIDTPMIVRLAGMMMHDDPDDLTRSLEKIISDGSVMILHPRRSSLILATIVAKEFLSTKDEDIITCIRNIIFYLEQYDFLSEGNFAYESIAFDKIFADYYSYTDLTEDAACPWNLDKNYNQAAQSIAVLLPGKIQIWVYTIEPFLGFRV